MAFSPRQFAVARVRTVTLSLTVPGLATAFLLLFCGFAGGLRDRR